MLYDLSTKQSISLRDSDGRINIWDGSVRSGKSFSALLRFIEFAMSDIEGDMIITGITEDSIKRNVITELARLLGADMQYLSGKREVYLWDRKVYVISANDDRAEGKIRGSTLAGGLVDEGTKIPENFLKMLLSRLSIEGAKLFITTNPDSPFHYLKTEFIDRVDELDLKYFKFVLDDNPSLSKSYKDNLKKEYRGLWYRRFIDGDWVLAEGAIYDFFDESIHCIDFPTSRGKYYVVGVDYGTTNPCAFSLIGFNPEKYPNMWVEKEYYWNSKKHLRQKTDSEYADDLINFINGYNIKAILIDPSAASFINECRKKGIQNIIDTNNDVLDGIRYVSQLITQGTLKICKGCKNLLQEIQTYIWDEVAALRGVEKPKKANDHCFVGDTIITTLRGAIPIKSVVVGDEVLTRIGYKKVVKTHCHEAEVRTYNVIGKEITCTPEHKFYTLGRGWKEVSLLIQSDILLIKKTKELEECLRLKSKNLMELNIEDTLNQKIYQMPNILDAIKLMQCEDMDIYIEMCGSISTEKYPINTMFITLMGIPQTMILTTLDWLNNQTICECMEIIGTMIEGKEIDYTWKEFVHLRKNGIAEQKGKNGINDTLLRLQKILNQKNTSVSNVQSHLEKSHTEQINFVRISVSQNGEEIIALMMSLESVFNAESLLQQTNIVNKNYAVQNVCGHTEDVYNLTIDGLPEFFANDVLVHNCSDATRYGCMYFYDRGFTNTTAEELDARYNKAMGIQTDLPAFFQDNFMRL